MAWDKTIHTERGKKNVSGEHYNICKITLKFSKFYDDASANISLSISCNIISDPIVAHINVHNITLQSNTANWLIHCKLGRFCSHDCKHSEVAINVRLHGFVIWKHIQLYLSVWWYFWARLYVSLVRLTEQTLALIQDLNNRWNHNPEFSFVNKT